MPGLAGSDAEDDGSPAGASRAGRHGPSLTAKRGGAKAGKASGFAADAAIGVRKYVVFALLQGNLRVRGVLVLHVVHQGSRPSFMKR